MLRVAERSGSEEQEKKAHEVVGQHGIVYFTSPTNPWHSACTRAKGTAIRMRVARMVFLSFGRRASPLIRNKEAGQRRSRGQGTKECLHLAILKVAAGNRANHGRKTRTRKGVSDPGKIGTSKGPASSPAKALGQLQWPGP